MKKNKNLWKKRAILFFISQCITLFGSQIVQMAIVWYVTLQTGSGAWIAAFSVCSYLPQFFVSLFGGALADRRNRKFLIIGADALIAAVTLGMLLILPQVPSEPVLLTSLLIMSILRSAGAGIQTPAVNAVIPQLVPEEHLMRWNGINAAMQSVVQFAAPAAAAVILSANTLRTTLVIDLLTAGIGIGLFTFLRLPKQVKFPSERSVWTDMGTGVRYAYSHTAIRKILIIYGLFVFLTVPAGYLSGLLVSRVYGNTYWYLTAVELAGFGGMMAGGLFMSLWGGFKHHRHTLAAGLTFFGSMAVGMGISRSFALYLVLMALYGAALTAVQTTLTTMLQETAGSSMQGRMFGLMSSLYSGSYPLGMAIFGPLADRMSLPSMMILSGILLIITAIWAFFCRKRELYSGYN